MGQRLGIVELFPPRSSFSNSNEGDFGLNVEENNDSDCGKEDSCSLAELCSGDIRLKDMCRLFGIEEILVRINAINEPEHTNFDET